MSALVIRRGFHWFLACVSAIVTACAASVALAQDRPAPSGQQPPGGGASLRKADATGQQATQPDQGAKPSAALEYVRMETSMGDIILELNHAKAPISVDNFLAYVDKGFYNGTIFHRVIPGFMIQGGGFTPDMQQKQTGAPIKNEWENGLKNTRGTMAMARLGDRRPNPSTVDSATAQFFINVVDNPGLDRPQADGGAYAVFGQVIAGMDVVDAIKVVPTGNRGQHQNVPLETVTIKKVERITAADAKAAVANTLKPSIPPAGSAPEPAPASSPATKPG